jgi:autotransporter-like protein
MRNRYVSVFSLSLLPLALYGQSVNAAEITISDAQTTQQQTATIDGGAAGDILVDQTGSIILPNGIAVLLNSNNMVTNQGLLQVDDSMGAIGLNILGGNAGSVTNEGDVLLPSLDGVMWEDNKAGLLLSGPGAFTGDITNEATGIISITGDNSAAVSLSAPLIGDFISEGQIGAAGNDSFGLLVGDAITGSVRNAGALSTSIVVSDLDGDPETEDLFYTNAPLAIGASISGGVLNDGLTFAERNDGIDDTGVSSGSIITSGGSESLLISPSLRVGGPADIVIGASARVATGESFVNLGTIGASSQSLVPVTGVRIEGISFGGTDYTTTLTGGILNDGSISAVARTANATGLSIGTFAIVPSISNSDIIDGTVTSVSGPHDAVGIMTSGVAGTTSITNTGAITANLTAVEGNAIAILDLTGAITSVYNEGAITAIHNLVEDGIATVKMPGIALDLSAGATDVTLTNVQAPTDAVGVTGLIGGDILFGSGNDTFTQTSGAVSGDIDFGAGADILTIDGGRVLGDVEFGTGVNSLFLAPTGSIEGDVLATGGTLTADIRGQLSLQTAVRVGLTTLNIAPGAEIWFPIDTSGLSSAGFDVTGTATIDSTAIIVPTFTTVLTSAQTFDLVTAGTLNLVGGMPTLDLDQVPYIYDFTLMSAGDLQLEVAPKDAATLGLSPAQLTLYAPLLEVAATDEDLTTTLHSIQSNKELTVSLNRIMPNHTNALYHLGVQSFDGMATAALNTKQRASTIAVHSTRFWAQEGGVYRDQAALDGNPGYIGREFKMTGGFDVEANSLDRLGLAINLSYSGFKPDGGPSNPYNTMATWFAAYAAKSIGKFEVNGIAGWAFTKNTSDRVIEFEDRNLRAKGDWTGSQFAGRIEGKVTLGSDDLYMRPRASLTYFSLSEDSYVENGDVGAAFTASDFSLNGLRGEVGSIFGWKRSNFSNTLTTEVEVGWRQDFGASDEMREYQFNGGTTPFELVTQQSDEGAAVVGLSVFGGSDFTTLGFSYRGAFDGDNSDHYIRAVIRSRF